MFTVRVRPLSDWNHSNFNAGILQIKPCCQSNLPPTALRKRTTIPGATPALQGWSISLKTFRCDKWCTNIWPILLETKDKSWSVYSILNRVSSTKYPLCVRAAVCIACPPLEGNVYTNKGRACALVLSPVVAYIRSICSKRPSCLVAHRVGGVWVCVSA